MSILTPQTVTEHKIETTQGLLTEVGHTPVVSIAIMILGLGVLVMWLALAPISTVVLGQGEVTFSGQDRALKSSLDAVVVRVLKQPGQSVMAGEVIAELDPIIAGQPLSQLNARRDELTLIEARLNAEKAANSEITFPASLASSSFDAIKAREVTLFAAHQAQHTQLFSDFDAAIENARQVVAQSLDQQRAATRAAQDLADDLSRLRVSSASNFVARGRVDDMEEQTRQASSDERRLAQNLNSAQATFDRLTARKQAAQEALQSHLQDELSQVEVERKGLELKLNRINSLGLEAVLRADVDGVVDDKEFVEVGTHVRAGQAIAHLLPTNLGDRVELSLSPRDVRRVHPGQAARVRLIVSSAHETDRSAVVEAVTDAGIRLRLTDPAKADPSGQTAHAGTVAEVWIDADRRSLLQLALRP